MVQAEGGEGEAGSDRSAAPGSGPLDPELARLEAAADALEAGTAEAIADIVPRAQALGAPAALGRALCLQARALAALGHPAKAVPLADAAIAAFAELAPDAAPAYAGFHAEAWRVAGVTRTGPTRTAEALRLIEQAVLIAKAGVLCPEPQFDGTPICASTALIRGRGTLGGILLAMGDLAGALDVLDGALAAIDAAPQKAVLIPEDRLSIVNDIIETLHRLAREKRALGEPEAAAKHLEDARVIVENRLKPMALAEPTAKDGLRIFGRGLRTYWTQKGESFLLRKSPSEALVCFLEGRNAARITGVTRLELGTVSAGLAQACLALGRNDQALLHAQEAADQVGEEDAHNRSSVLLVLSRAWRAVGDFKQALDYFEQFNAVRNRLEAASARQHAARLGLERARAEAGRKNIATLEGLGQIGQQITASLQAEKTFGILYRHVGSLLDAPAFLIWLLDSEAASLRMAFGLEDGRPVSGQDIRLGDPASRAALAVRERREILVESGTGAGQILGKRRMRTMLFAPLLVAEHCLGVLSVQSDRPRAYDRTARWILRTLCAYAAIALDNAASQQKLNETLAQLRDSGAQLARRTEELERLATIDPLTSAGNRRYLEAKAIAEIAAAHRQSRPLGIALFDIDHFKTINDQFGHAAGDNVLKDIVDVARRMLRPSDFLARLGGEEFALLLPASDRIETVAVAERIRMAIEAVMFSAGTSGFTVTASFGTSELGPGETDLSASLNRADKALYRAKQTGRNRVVSV